MAFTLGLAQCCHPGDGDVLGMVKSWMARAKNAGVDVLVFPESLMTPYELDVQAFADASEPLDGPFCTGINALAAEFGLWVVYTANERADDEDVKASRTAVLPPFNTAIMVGDDGAIRGIYRKVHLFDTDFTRESDKVAAGIALPAAFDTPFGRIGLGICYDVRFPEFARALALKGCDLLIYPAAWVDGPRKVDQWHTLLAARAIENELFVAGLSRCDRGFGEAKRDYAGHSCVFGPLGNGLAMAAGIDEELVVTRIDLDEIAAARAAMPVLDHRRTDLYG